MAKKSTSEEEDILKMMADPEDDNDGEEVEVGPKATRIEVEIGMDGEDDRSWEPGNEKKFLDSHSDEDVDFEIELDEDDEIVKDDAKKAEESKKPVTEQKEVVVEEDDKEEVASKQKEADEAVEKGKKRSEERIRELAREKNEERQKRLEAEDRANKMQLGFAKQMSERLKSDMEAYETQFKEAMTDNDPEALLAAQKNISQTMARKAQLDAYLEEAEAKKADKEEPAKVTADDIKETRELPIAAQEWLENKKDYLQVDKYRNLPLSIRKKVQPVRDAVFALSNQLLQEGYKTDDEMFYEELDLRLSNKFDYYDALALKGLDALQSDTEPKKKTSEVQNDTSSGETKKPQSDKRSKVPVTDSSASSLKTPSNNSSKTRVKISASQKQFYHEVLEPKGMTWDYYVKLVKDNSDD